MASPGDTRPRMSQSPIAPALRPRHISASPLSFSRAAPTMNLSTPSVKRRCVSTGSIPGADDPFSSTSNSIETDRRYSTAASISYPALPDFQAHRHDGSPSASHINTPNTSAGPVTTPSRPSRMRDRTVSDTAQLQTPPKEPKHLTVSDVDAEIEHWIRNRLPESERNETGVGNNYTFEATLSANTTTPGIRLMKIGCTSKRPRVRAARIQYECGKHEEINGIQDDLETVDEHELSTTEPHRPQPMTRPVRLFRRVERLAHAQLKRHVHIFTCKTCGRQHHEYFEVDLALAHSVQEIWRDFVLHEPYNTKGYLIPFWEARLRAWRHRAAVDSEDDENSFHKKLQHWNSFANPYLVEFLWHDLSLISATLWTRKWQSLVFLQGFVIACLTFPSFWAFVCFALLALAILVEACFGGEDGLVTRSGERLCSLSELVKGARRVVKLLTG